MAYSRLFSEYWRDAGGYVPIGQYTLLFQTLLGIPLDRWYDAMATPNATDARMRFADRQIIPVVEHGATVPIVKRRK